MALSTLTIDLAANVARFESDLKRAGRVSKKETAKLRKDAVQAGKRIGVALAAAAAGLTVMVRQTINAADEMQKLSLRTKASTEFLSEMRLAMELSGIEFSTFTNAMGKMQKAIGDAVVGLSTQKRAFEELGIDLQQFRSLKPEEQFEELAEAIKQVGVQSQRVRIVRDIFGRAGQELLSLFESGKKGIREFREEAQKLGLTIDQDLADNAARFNDQMTRLKRTSTAYFIDLTGDLLPTLNNMADALIRMRDETSRAEGEISILAKTFQTLIAWMVAMKGIIDALLAALIGLAATAANAFKAVLAPVQATLEALGLAAAAIAKGEFKQAWEDITSIVERTDRNWNQALAGMATGVDQIVGGAGFELQEMMANILAISAPAAKAIADVGEEAEEAGEEFGITAAEADKLSKAVAKMLDEATKNAEGIRDSLLTPLEALRIEFQQNEMQLLAYIGTLEKGTAEYEEWIEVLARLRKQFKEQEAALKGALTPYEQLVQSIEREIQLMEAGEQARLVMIARWELERQGIENVNAVLADYLRLVERRNELILDQAGFDQQGNITDFASVIRRAVEKGIKSGFDGFAGNLKKAIQQDPFGFTEGVANTILEFKRLQEAGASDLRALAEVVQQFDPTGITKALIAIDNLFGGKLFGTKFATDKTVTQLGLDAQGAFGGTSIFQSKEKSFFRGTSRRVLEEKLSADARNAIEDVFDAVQEAIEIAAKSLAITIPDVIGGIFEQEFDAEGNLVREFSQVNGRQFSEDFQAFAQRLIAENILAAVAQTAGDVEVARTVQVPIGREDRFEDRFGSASDIPGFFTTITVMMNEVEVIADRWRDDAEKLLEGARFLLTVATDMRLGFNLLNDGTLTETTDLIESLSGAGEELAVTYGRVKADTELLELAMRVLGTELDLSREEFIRFAVEIETAAGGLDRAAQLWSAFFENFLTENERATADLGHAITTRDAILADIGQDAASFEAAFRAALPSLSAEEIVTWLRAAEAIGVVMDLEQQLAEQRQELLEILSEAGVLSNFQAAALDLQTNLNEAIKRAEQLGASERELALIRQHANRSMARLVAELQAQTAQLAANFLGINEERLNDLEAERDAIQEVRNERQAQFRAERQAIERLRDFADSLLLNQQLTPLTPRAQLDEARRQFESNLGAARGGDVGAIGELQGSAQTFLTIARDFFASSPDFTRIFDQVQGSLRGIDARNPTVALTEEMVGVQAEIIELRETLEANSQALADFAAALEIETLISNLADLARISGTPIEDVAASFGLDLADIRAALEELAIPGLDVETIIAQVLNSDAIGANAFGQALDPLATSFANYIDQAEDYYSGDSAKTDRILSTLDKIRVLLQRAQDQQAA